MSLVTPFVSDVPLGLHESMPETKAISFADNRSEFLENLLDIVNPLQHIPGVSTIYRAITGDDIAAPARIIGGALFGGPIGLASATGNMLLEEASGNDLVGHALALVGGLSEAPEVAAAAFTPPTPQAAIDLVAADGGLKTVPELANAAAPVATVTPPAPQAAASMATAGDGVEIIWNGPRVLPSLTRAPAVQSSSASGTADEISVAGAPASDAAPANTGAIRPAPGVSPAWMGTAITDAQSVQDAAQLGRATQKIEGQPWVSDAMIDALNKYETLARGRNR